MKYVVTIPQGEDHLYLATGYSVTRNTGNWSSSPNAALFDTPDEAQSVADMFFGSKVTTLYSKDEVEALDGKDRGYSRQFQPDNKEVVDARRAGTTASIPTPAIVYINMHDHKFSVTTKEYGRETYKSLNELLTTWWLMAAPDA